MGKTRSLAELTQSLRAFQESRVLLTALELDVFSAVREGAGAPAVAQALGADPGATERLLDALVALGALLKREGVYRCTSESRALASGRAGLLHTVHLWTAWSHLTDSVRTGRPAPRPARDLEAAADSTRAFIAAMHARAQEAAQETVALAGAPGTGRMLDVGGGSGAFAMAFARAWPGLHAEVLDLETVRPLAEEYIRQGGMQDRVTVRPGDMREAELGEGYDLVLLSAVCHMFGEAENRDLIGRCARALAPGGRLVIREFILEEDRVAPPSAALFALNMLVGTERGNAYSEGQYRAWMEEAGLSGVHRPDPEGDVILGTRI